MKVWRGSLLLILFLSAIVIVACSRGTVSGTSSSGEGVQYSAEVTNGGWFYVNYGCVQCHGLGGRGRDLMPAAGPSLVSTDFKKAFPKGPQFDSALVQMIKNGAIIEKDGVASMPAWNGILTDENMGDIVAYIRAGLPDLGLPIPGTRTGQEIYSSFACSKCHGELGVGGIRNIAASNPEQRTIPKLGGADFRGKFGSPANVRAVILHGSLVDQGRPGVVYMPAWGRIGTAEEIDRIVDYIWNFD
ncbi:MAG: c-type cytochrome [Chloroflexi bacterium]|nr:c-type cytochrome [Chloroflexota bacterium]